MDFYPWLKIHRFIHYPRIYPWILSLFLRPWELGLLRGGSTGGSTRWIHRKARWIHRLYTFLQRYFSNFHRFLVVFWSNLSQNFNFFPFLAKFKQNFKFFSFFCPIFANFWSKLYQKFSIFLLKRDIHSWK